MRVPKDTDLFLVGHGYTYHARNCDVVVRYPDNYKELSYGEIRAIHAHDGKPFEPHGCVLESAVAATNKPEKTKYFVIRYRDGDYGVAEYDQYKEAKADYDDANARYMSDSVAILEGRVIEGEL